jgi:hypothetical protein
MLHTITHLKAPWPLGALVGDVIDLPSVPVWAVGKCTPADADAVATVALDVAIAAPGVTVVSDIAADDSSGAAALAEAEAQAIEERAEITKTSKKK